MSKKKNNLLSIFEEDAKQIKEKSELPTNEKLDELSKKVNKVANLEMRILEQEEALRTLKKGYNDLVLKQIPDFFDELGLSKLTLTDGTEINIKREYTASITKDNKEACHKWLNKNGFEALIKHEVKAKLKKGELKEAEKLVQFIISLGVTYTDTEAVHAGTLKAFINEQMEAGSDIPQELFKVFPIRIAKIKLGTF